MAVRLSAMPDVRKVYCLVRTGSPIESYDRLTQSLRARRVYSTLDDSARSKLIAVPAVLSEPDLGLGSTAYNSLTTEVTDVIHCAWSVNFNLHLTSFEKDSIAGLKNLLDLCLKAQRPTPASFNFCSSVSAVVNTEDPQVPEALPKQLSYAQNMGYAQSKLVGEHICANAARQTGLKTRILRIGQVIGDRKHGIWNPAEAVPLMLQCAITIGALPRLNEYPLWLPVDTVAETVVEISLADSDTLTRPGDDGEGDAYDDVFNIISPCPFHWTRDLLPFLRSADLEFEELAPRDWIRRLRSSSPDPVANPPIKLVEFFAGKYDTDEPRRKLGWDTDKTRRVSSALRNSAPLDQEIVRRMVSFFREECWGPR